MDVSAALPARLPPPSEFGAPTRRSANPSASTSPAPLVEKPNASPAEAPVKVWIGRPVAPERTTAYPGSGENVLFCGAPTITSGTPSASTSPAFSTEWPK